MRLSKVVPCRVLVAPVLAGAALALAVPAHGAVYAAAATTCPASFTVLHNDRVGSMK